MGMLSARFEGPTFAARELGRGLGKGQRAPPYQLESMKEHCGRCLMVCPVLLKGMNVMMLLFIIQ